MLCSRLLATSNSSYIPPMLAHASARLRNRASGDLGAQRLLKRRADVDLADLSMEAERVGEVRKRLAVVDDALAEELEGQDAGLAVGQARDGEEDGGLRDVGADGEVVDAGVEHHVVDEEGADPGAVEVVREGRVADLKRQDGGVRDVDEAVEVVAAGVGRRGDVGGGDLQSLEAVEAWTRRIRNEKRLWGCDNDSPGRVMVF